MSQTTQVAQTFRHEADAILERSVRADAPVAGVVAMPPTRRATSTRGRPAPAASAGTCP
jgi:hypothetical protein